MLDPSVPRKHLGNHTVGYCASYFVSFMNEYVNIYVWSQNVIDFMNLAASATSSVPFSMKPSDQPMFD